VRVAGRPGAPFKLAEVHWNVSGWASICPDSMRLSLLRATITVLALYLVVGCAWVVYTSRGVNTAWQHAEHDTRESERVELRLRYEYHNQLLTQHFSLTLALGGRWINAMQCPTMTVAKASLAHILESIECSHEKTIVGLVCSLFSRSIFLPFK
jgi:hypothetical protein